jgi:hypothetical protein
LKNQIIERRKALKYLGLLTATAAGRDFLAAWLPSKSSTLAAEGKAIANHAGMHHGPAPMPEDTTPYMTRFFKPEEFETVEILAEMIIPADDKPGARDAQVGRYIDFVVFSAAEHEPELQKGWVSGLAQLNGLSGKKFGRSFREISADDREQLLLEMSGPERDPKASHPGFEFYRLLKEMTVEGFYTSRIGLVQVLEYKGLDYLTEFPGCTHPEHKT